MKKLLVILMMSGSVFVQLFAGTRVTAAREAFIKKLYEYEGKPYQYGAYGPDSFDCSGLIYTTSLQVFPRPLPRTTRAIENLCLKITTAQKEPGDLIFFQVDGRINHVAVYIGGGKMIHCVSDGPKTGVIVSDINERYWRNHFSHYGRFLKATLEEHYTEAEKKKYLMSEPKPAGV